jgi:hypothetical protein
MISIQSWSDCVTIRNINTRLSMPLMKSATIIAACDRDGPPRHPQSVPKYSRHTKGKRNCRERES